jgi:competence protein ComEC
MLSFESSQPLDHYGILARLLFGKPASDGTQIDEGIFRLLGFVHLFSASGIHIYALLRLIERGASRMASAIGVSRYAPIVKRIQFCAGLGFLFLVWTVQSYRLGFARPISIFLLRTYAREAGFKWQVFYPLVLTFLIDVLISIATSPHVSFLEILIEGGRLHYYLAVGGALWCLSVCKFKNIWLEHAAMAVGSWIWIAPFDLWQHHLISWMTPVLSVVTLPLITLVLYPASLISFLFTGKVAHWIVEFWNGFIGVLLKGANLGLTFSIVSERAMVFSAFLAAALIFLWTFFFSEMKSKFADSWRVVFVACVCFFVLELKLVSPVFLSNEQVSQLDVKQGDSALFSLRGRNEMVDVGSARALKSAEWIEKFATHGVLKIDTVLLSHLDEDHVGALKEILPWIKVDAVQTHHEHWQSEKGHKLATVLRENFPELKQLDETQNGFQLGKTIWLKSSESHDGGNDLMMGVAVPLNSNKIYLGAGDSDVSQEENYLQANWQMISGYRTRIWKVSHHGSRFSSDPVVLGWLHPTRSWISVGAHNTYHHPHVNTLATLQGLHLRYERTDQRGDLTEYTNQSFF